MNTTLNKKSKELKTKKKTQVEGTTKNSNIKEKEDKNYMQEAMLKSLYNLNGHICNYNKKYRQHMDLDNKDQFIKWLYSRKNIAEIKKAYAIVGLIEQKRFELLREEYIKLDKYYGQEDIHPSELEKKEESNMESQSKQMRDTQKAYEDKLNAVIIKAVREAVKEELDKKGGE